MLLANIMHVFRLVVTRVALKVKTMFNISSFRLLYVREGGGVGLGGRRNNMSTELLALAVKSVSGGEELVLK